MKQQIELNLNLTTNYKPLSAAVLKQMSEDLDIMADMVDSAESVGTTEIELDIFDIKEES